MSTPTRQLRKLRIEDMPMTRSQRRALEQRQRETEASERVMPSIEVPNPASTVQDIPIPAPVMHGHSGIAYDYQQPRQTSQHRTLEGLTAEFDIYRSTDFSSFYAIQLHRPISVCIHDPSNSDTPVTCSCGEANPVCRHIIWLFDRLTAAVGGGSPSGPPNLTAEGIVSEIGALYRIIRENADLQQILRLSRDEYADSESEPDSDEEINTRHSERDLTQLKYSLQDMLSVFDPALPREYGRAFVDHIPLGPTYFAGNLAATIFSIALYDDSFYNCLRDVLTPGLCAARYFEKQRNRAHEAMADLGVYAGEGRPAVIDVPTCARQLRLIVDEVRHDRQSRAPLSATVASYAAGVLVGILGRVVGDSNQDEKDRSLYLQLIGDPPRYSSAQPDWMTNDFVIGPLNDFPIGEWSRFLDRLTTILDQIREHEGSRSAGYVERYIRRFSSLLADSAIPGSAIDIYEPSSSAAGRRPQMVEERGSRRRRIG